MAWAKKKCFVVTAFYRDELYQEDKTPLNEEEVFFSESEAEDCKAKFEMNEEFEDAYISEDVREFWVDEDEARRIELRKMDAGVLLATLDDEVQKFANQNNEEWAKNVSKSYYLAIKNEIALRLREI